MDWSSNKLLHQILQKVATQTGVCLNFLKQSASQSQGVPSCGENTITGTIEVGYSYVWNNRTSGWGENAGRYGGWGWKVRCVR